MEADDNPELDRIVRNLRFLIENGHLRPTRLPGVYLTDPKRLSPAAAKLVTRWPWWLPRPSLGLPWIVLAAGALVLAAHMLRYERMPPEQGAALVFWDRWTHRVCAFESGRWVCFKSVSVHENR